MWKYSHPPLPPAFGSLARLCLPARIALGYNMLYGWKLASFESPGSMVLSSPPSENQDSGLIRFEGVLLRIPSVCPPVQTSGIYIMFLSVTTCVDW